ncbi:hypothetical protein [Streptococcus equinus]|uniref:hypothetical protein n=1 Tax=Streptococcus equinus TaxID=1335 RepID=UPI003BF8593E
MEVMIETCCGIDVHQKSIICCILDGPLDTNKPKKIQKKFRTTYEWKVITRRPFSY